MPLIPGHGRQRQEYLCELEASLVYKAGSRTAREGYYTKKPYLEKHILRIGFKSSASAV